MQRFVTVACALVIAATLAPAARAGGPLVRMIDAEFRPRTLRVAVGADVTWRNDGFKDHRTEPKKPYPSAWNRLLDPDESWTKEFRFVGTYGYFCDLHSDGTTGMVGRLEIPVVVTPASGNSATSFTIRLATVVPPEGWSFEVQRNVNGNGWAVFRDATRNRTIGYHSAVDGTHRFRARLERPAVDVSHGWSPLDAITIS